MFCFQSLDKPASRYHEAVEGFFGASQGRADNTSFEGGNKSGATAQGLLDFCHAQARTTFAREIDLQVRLTSLL